jgi:hypothetical protein
MAAAAVRSPLESARVEIWLVQATLTSPSPRTAITDAGCTYGVHTLYIPPTAADELPSP